MRFLEMVYEGGKYNISHADGTSRTGSAVTRELPSGDSAKLPKLVSDAPSCFTSKCLLPTTTQRDMFDGAMSAVTGSSGRITSNNDRPVPTTDAPARSAFLFSCPIGSATL